MAPPDPVTVYRVTCLVNGKAYIGITSKTLLRRWREHVARAISHATRTRLARAIRSYGPERFTVDVVYEAVDTLEARMVERGLIAQYGTLAPRGYNLSNGGEGNVGRQLAPDARKRVSEAMKALWADPVYRTRIEATFKNRVFPESHITHLRLLANGQKGTQRSAESLAKQRATMIGHAVSDETREKIGAKSKGRVWSAERKASHGALIRARRAAGAYAKVSEKMKAEANRRWADPEFRAKHVGKKHGPYKKKQVFSELTLRVRALVAEMANEYVARAA